MQLRTPLPQVSHFTQIHHEGMKITDHPAYMPPDGPEFVVYEDPLLNCGTAKVADVQKILDRIQDEHVDRGTRKKVIFVVGDQQTIDRILTCKLAFPTKYNWCIPVAGDFHFLCHSVAATHDLWWIPASSWAVEKLNSITENKPPGQSDNIAEFKHYDRWYTLLTVSILTLLHRISPHLVLQDPEELK